MKSKYAAPRFVPIGSVRGLYQDEEKNEIVVDCDEMLEFFGWENTPENARKISSLAIVAVRSVFPDMPAIADFKDGSQN